MIIATAGHVDHGKTELVRALTGIDTDRLPEEKARGLSIDLGFAYQRLAGDETLGFVDVPGHEKFIRNMLAGVGGIDLGLLVVAADDGVMPQTREHLAILDLLGIVHYRVAITKIDRVEEQRLQEVRKQVTSLLAGHGYDDAPIYPVCAPRNQGVDALRQAIHHHAGNAPARSADGRLRVAIDRVFTLKGVGLVVTGMVLAGTAQVDDILLLSADGTEVRVRGIRVHDTPGLQARAGERCAFHIGGRGIGEASIRRGDWLLHPDLYAPTRRIDVDLAVLAREPRALKHWTPVHLHIGADRINARVAILAGGTLAAGESGLVQLVLERDAFTLHGDRFVLRDQSARRTMAGGHVIDPFAPRRGRARPERLAALRAMNRKRAEAALEALAESSAQGVPLNSFALARNLDRDRVEAMIQARSLHRVGAAHLARVFADGHWTQLLAHVEQALGAFHAARPDAPGASSRDLQLALKPRHDLAIVEAAMDELVRADRLGRHGARVQLPGHAISVSEPDRQLWTLAAAYLAPGTGSPLSLHQAAQALGIDVNVLEKSLKRGVRAGEMLWLTGNRYAPSGYVAGLARAAQILATESQDGTFSVAEYCKRTETGRNFAIDLLEHFDRQGFTVRSANRRRLRHPDTDITHSE